MSRKIVSNVRAHNDKMFKLSEKNRETPAFNVRQFTNPFMLASTQSLLTQLVAKSGGVTAVPTTSASLGTVAEPFVESATTKAEAAPLAGESTAAETAADVFEASQEGARRAEEARHAAHQAYKQNKKEYAKELAAESATLPNGWSLENTPAQYAAKLAENTDAYKKSQVDGVIDLMEEMEKPRKYTGRTRATQFPAKYKMLGDTLKLAEAHLKVMKQHNKDQVAAYKKTYSSDKAKRAEGARLHKVYQDAHRMSRDNYAASYKAQQAAHLAAVTAAAKKTVAKRQASDTIAAALKSTAPAKTTTAPAKTTTAPTSSSISRLKAATAKLKAGTKAAKAATSASKTSRSSADAKAAAATAKAIPDSADIPVNGNHPNDSKEFASAVNAYKNRMSALAKSLKPSTAKESKEQLKREEAELFKIREGLAALQDKNQDHINTLAAAEAGAFTGPMLAKYNALDAEGKKQVGLAVNKYTEARGELIRYDAANEANKLIPPVNFSSKTHTQRRAELKRVAEPHLKYIKWAAEHQRLYGELVKARNAARASLKKQGGAAPEASAAERGVTASAASQEQAAAVSAGGT